MILRYLLKDRRHGTYVDLGVYHPILLSNTYHFYSCGWRGLNVDVRPLAIELCRTLRQNDVSVLAAVSDTSGETVDVFEFDPAALTTLSAESAERYRQLSNVRFIGRSKVQTRRLNEILDEHWSLGAIDLMSVDLEGLDERVLRSLNWNRYRPRVLCFELNEIPFEAVPDAPLVQFLKSMNYRLEARLDQSIVMALA
ncbi:MAG: FkbM family methyltransferase [Anaerolineae bacterium]|nr:FkbM family methyltransferase [Phycisphaerae bacterium]